MHRRRSKGDQQYWQELWFYRWWRRLFMALAALVVVCTVHWLTFPAITMQIAEETDVGEVVSNEAVDSQEQVEEPDDEETNGEATVVSENPRHTSGEASDSQRCGMLSDEVEWHLNEQGVLTISGHGILPDRLRRDDAPWREYRQNIRQVVIEEGITELGCYALYGLDAAIEIQLPASLKCIDEGALADWRSLQSIQLPGQLEMIGNDAFLGDEKIRILTLPQELKTLQSLPPNLEQLVVGSVHLEEIGEWDSGDYAVQLADSVVTLPVDFKRLLRHASMMTVAEDLILQVEEGAMQSDILADELQLVSGRVFMRTDGSVYCFDEENHMWMVVYLPAVPGVTILKEIDGVRVGNFAERALDQEGLSEDHPLIDRKEHQIQVNSKDLLNVAAEKMATNGTDAASWTIDYGIYHPEAGVYEKTNHYVVHEGESVTYRMTLNNPTDQPVQLSLAGIDNMLTETRGVFAWEKGKNVQVSVSGENESTQFEDVVLGYCVEQSETDAEPTYTLGWNQSTVLTLDADETLYIDITLTYPTGELFQSYARKANGRLVSNTLHAGDDFVVKHSMAVQTEAILQTGVLTTGYTSGKNYIDDGDRRFYVNSESNERYVIYYITLYNSGATRLYLSPISDKFPKGIKYKGLVYGKTPTTAEIMTGNAVPNSDRRARRGNWTDLCDVIGLDNYYNSYISLSYSSLHNSLDISFRDKSGTRDDDHLISEADRFYLAPGRAVEFAILCTIGQEVNTEDLATNTVSMAFADYLGTGFQVADVPFGARSDMATEGQNDGDCTLAADGRLISTVTIQRQKTAAKVWQIDATKKDADTNALLEGAAFALYGREASACMKEERWRQLSPLPARTMEEEGVIWYLCETGTTDSAGVVRFGGLSEESYRLVEYQAPTHYVLEENVLICNQADAVDEVLAVYVTNRIGYEIPETGGPGTTGYAICGCGLLGVCLMLMGYRWRRRL